MSAPVQVPIFEEICFELDPICGPYVYMAFDWKDGGWHFVLFDKSQIIGIDVQAGEEFNQYVPDIAQREFRTTELVKYSREKVKVFKEVSADRFLALMDLCFDAKKVLVYLGLNGTIHEWVEVKVTGGTREGFVNSNVGQRRFELEFEHQPNYTKYD